MRKIIFGVLVTTTIAFTGCDNSSRNKEQKVEDAASTNKPKDSVTHATTNEKDIKAVAVTYTDVDAKLAASIKEIIDHYLHIKNGLASDNAKEAASGAKAMSDVLAKVDKSLFTTAQKSVYDQNEDDLKEHAEHISKKSDDIKHQREHFSIMSEDVYALAKAFGGGRLLYHDHCPMYNNNKGGMWLSEMKEIKNPYFGSEMLTCGSIEEIIK